MQTQAPPLQTLQNVLHRRSDGPIGGEDREAISPLLQAAWPSIQGTDIESTTSDKLTPDRLENLTWSAPFLTFTIERHGATINGSSRAKLHDWSVDVDAGIATAATHRFRQLEPRAGPFTEKEAKAIAEELLSLATRAEADPRIKINPDKSVTLILSKASGPSNPQTQAGRNKRLRKHVDLVFLDAKWISVRVGSQCRFKEPETS